MAYLIKFASKAFLSFAYHITSSSGTERFIATILKSWSASLKVLPTRAPSILESSTLIEFGGSSTFLLIELD